ncbi:MAG: glycoside hydrolase [Bacteroidetes bacterium HGW-Bacteroidetes-4]|jgi:1,4-alpha-glucan branching enzyme|nr:MAG: glycoside hydrolase [Bacteroidetes bacterium HGW-Bacteroidetes-4]
MIKKDYLKTKPLCKVTFKLSGNITGEATQVNLVGDFNDWDPKATSMKKLKGGDFTVTVNLPIDKNYQFKYLVDGNTWVNDDLADKYVPNNIDGDNSVVVV